MSTNQIELEQIELELPALHPAQQRVMDERRRFNCLMAGRRFGKSTLGRHLLMNEALQGNPAAWIAPTYKYLVPNWRTVCETLRPVIIKKSEEEKSLTLIGGGEIDFWSADAGAPGEGRKYALVVVDEAALIGTQLETLWTRSLRPTLADLQGSAWFLSTPKAANSYFGTLYSYGQGDRPDWASWKIGTRENPFISPEEIDAARADMPAMAFSQEFLGEMVSWTGSVFRFLEKAILDMPLHAQYERWNQPIPWSLAGNLEFYIAADWAGAGRSATGDFTAYIVLASDGTVCHIDRFRADYAMQRVRLQALIERFHPAAVLCESNSIGSPQIAELRRSGLAVQGFTMTNATKARLVEQLALAFESGKVRIPDIENRAVLLAELMSFEGTSIANGLTRFAAPAPGSHDDLVIAMMLAWEAAFSQKGCFRGDYVF